MATSAPIIAKQTTNTRIEVEDPCSTLYVENLLGGLNEWRNIQDIVRSTFKALCEVVRSQGIAIKELEKQVTTKASKSELNSGLNIKANVTDIMRTFSEVATNIEVRPTMEDIQTLFDDKISKSDLQFYLNSKPSLEEVRHLVETKVGHSEMQSELTSISLKVEEYQKKSNQFITAKDFSHFQQLLDQKANINEVNDALAAKANKDIVITALHKKANKADVDAALKSKIELDEMQNIIKAVNQKVDLDDFEKLQSLIDTKAERSDVISLSNMFASKTDLKDFDQLNVMYTELKRDSSKRIEDIDQDLDRLIENIKKQFQNLNIVINNLDGNKVDFKEFEKLSGVLGKKVDTDGFQGAVSQLKFDVYESFSHYKNEILQNKKIFEDHINERISLSEKNTEKAIEELDGNRAKISEYLETRKTDQEEVMNQTRQILSSYSKDLETETGVLRNEIQKLNTDINEILNRKVEKKDFETIRNKFFNDLEQKSDVADLDHLYKNIQKSLNEKSDENNSRINSYIKSFENEFQKALEKKANIYDVTNVLNSKADSISLQNKVNATEFETLKLGFEKLNREILNKLDFNKFETYLNDTRATFDDLQKDLMMKANIKEMLSLLKNKSDIDDVNKALTQIHEELDSKANIEQFNSAMDNQAIINDAICAENCVARWTWKSGQVKNGYAVPWEIQTVNTAPDHFLWEKDKTSVMVVAAGLYEITMGFYADKKPTVQILVNGEPIMSAVNSANYVIYHNSSGKTKSVGKHSSGNITGITLIDFICLPERARLSISYSGEEEAEGFLGLRKI